MSFSLSLTECADELRSTVEGDDVIITGVSIDTRTLKAGELYVAIVGEQHDGHDFIEAAESAGACAVLVHQRVKTSLPQLLADDTKIALGQLANFWARRFQIPTIAVTGSNGKTTVKEIIASILRQLGPVLSTQGNLNNEIGVPLTLLRMRNEHIYAVIEMGASHAGEIARLVAMAEPVVALVNNVGTAHLEGFGSIEGIANAKAEIYAGLPDYGYAVINADDSYADFMRSKASHCRTREFALNADADVKGEYGPAPEIDCVGVTVNPQWKLAGEHNFMNALAAVAAVQCLDISLQDIVQGLEAIEAVPGRLERKPGMNGASIIDDSYNANPDSVRSAIEVLADCSGIRYLLLGDMAELGQEAEQLHVEIGELAGSSGIDGVWTIGALASNAHKAFVKHGAGAELEGSHCADHESMIKQLKPLLNSNVTVLIKGSRSAHMERVVDVLCSDPGKKASESLKGQSS